MRKGYSVPVEEEIELLTRKEIAQAGKTLLNSISEHTRSGKLLEEGDQKQVQGEKAYDSMEDTLYWLLDFADVDEDELI